MKTLPLFQTRFALCIPFLISLFFSCDKKDIEVNNFSAYFGGHIYHPKSDYILLYKQENLIDTLFLDKQNHFGKSFSFLAPGMYIIKHADERKYVYFDKNDSLFVRINAKDFDNASTFYGRGKDKNNCLLEFFAFSNQDRNDFFKNYKKSFKRFMKTADSLHDARTALYLRRKTEIGWDKDFDLYAKAIVDYDYYARLESYPYAHQKLTSVKVLDSLPENYYNFRQKIDLNNQKLREFRPFTSYLAIMLNSLVCNKTYKNEFERNIAKLNMVDSLISNQKVKNNVLNNIVFNYFIEDQNHHNNNAFLKRFYELSTDTIQRKEISTIQHAVKNLSPNSILPDVRFLDTNLKEVSVKDTIHNKTLIIFWTKNALSHYNDAQNIVLDLLSKNKGLQVIAINLDEDEISWKNILATQDDSPIINLHTVDFTELREKWAIIKLNRALLVNKNATINNGFVNIFEDDLDDILK
ncbi:hypothetical protein [Paenimyroides ceti]